ncbi:MAG TPA: hypothetical protein PKC28_09945 [Bdellovibrionales bacterium]|nr:hypothetical protein [Bdellovibrionales bacterium]
MSFDLLVQKPESQRDEAWEARFLEAFAQTKVELVKEEPQQGPDGWPYLLAKTGVGQEPVTKVIEWLYTRGVGLAVNTHKVLPDYIFTYGMIWNFAETGKFAAPQQAAPAGRVEIDGQKMLIGEPTQKYLPGYVREVLKNFLRAQGFPNPKIVAISSPDFQTVDLVFSAESLGGIPQAQHRVLAEAVGWFLPLHYSLLFESERELRGFVPL